MALTCFVLMILWTKATFGQTINVGSSIDYNSAVQTVNSNPNNNYTLNFVNGFTMNQPAVDFNSNSTITLTGNTNTIDGVNSYQPLVIDSGIVKVQSLNVVNPGSPIAVNGGSLIDTTGSLHGPIANNGSVQFDLGSGASYTYDGNMSGAGNVTIGGAGKVTFSGVNSYTGGTTIEHGNTLIGTTQSLTGPITDNWLVGFNQSTNGTYAGVISGSGGVEISNVGTITLTGANTYTGSTLVDGGARLVGTTSSLQGNIYNFGAVVFNQSTSGTYAGAISRTGLVEITGGGTVTLTGLNTYTGGTRIDQGSTLVGGTSSLEGPFLNNGVVRFNQSTAGTFSGGIGGTGSVEIAGGGPVTFSGANSYLGGTIVDANSTLIGSTNSLQGSMTNSGLVKFDQSGNGIYSGTISGTGRVEISGTGPIEFTGTTSSYTGGTTIDNASTLAGSTGTVQGNIVNNGSLQFNFASTTAFNGNISGTGAVEIKDNIAATLMGSNSYSGGTKVDGSATLIGTTSSIQGNIFNNGTVQFNSFPSPVSDPSGPGQIVPFIIGPGLPFWIPSNVYAGNMSGTGGVKITGGGEIFMTGANSYTGGTTVDVGNTLIGTTTSLQGGFTNDGFVRFIQNTGGTYAGNMSGSGRVEVSGGPFTFSGANTYTGGTTVDTGTTLIGTTASLQGGFNNLGVVQFAQSGIGTYAGNMSGTGSVEIGGGGKVTFSGTNTYTGGTTVDAGATLIGTTQSLQGTIVDNGLVKFNQSTYGSFIGGISGTGAVEIGGAGSLAMIGANTFTGGTTIDNGSTLVVAPGASIAGNINVNSGGVLTGPGMVGSVTVNAGGTIFPNALPLTAQMLGVEHAVMQTNAILIPGGGPLQISGNFTQGAGSKYSAELNPLVGDKIQVGGAAQINNGTVLNLVLDPGRFTVGSKYEILSAAGGLTGKYSFVSASPISQNITFSEQYGTNNLQVIVNSNLANSARTTNQLSIASAIDRASGSATGDYSNAITQLTTLGQGPLSSTLNQLSGDIYPSIGTIQRQTTTAQMQILSNRLAGLTASGGVVTGVARNDSHIRFVSSQGGAAPTPDAPNGSASSDPFGWTSWAQGYGLGGNIGGDGNAGGTNYRLGGTLFGVERWLSESTMVGVLGGYAGTSVGNHQDGSSAQINSYQVGLYELHRQEMLYFSNIDAFSDNQFNVSRPIHDGTIVRTASGNSNGSQWAHYSEAGATFDFDEIRLQPFLGLQYLYLDQGGYTESGAGSLDLTTSHQIVNSVRNSIGARVYQEAMWGNVLVVPSISARYQHEWGNGTSLVSSSLSGAPTAQFTTSGNHTGRDFGLLTLSATAYVTERFSVYTMIDTQFASSFFALIGSGGIQYSW